MRLKDIILRGWHLTHLCRGQEHIIFKEESDCCSLRGLDQFMVLMTWPLDLLRKGLRISFQGAG